MGGRPGGRARIAQQAVLSVGPTSQWDSSTQGARTCQRVPMSDWEVGPTPEAPGSHKGFRSSQWVPLPSGTLLPRGREPASACRCPTGKSDPRRSRPGSTRVSAVPSGSHFPVGLFFPGGENLPARADVRLGSRTYAGAARVPQGFPQCAVCSGQCAVRSAQRAAFSQLKAGWCLA